MIRSLFFVRSRNPSGRYLRERSIGVSDAPGSMLGDTLMAQRNDVIGRHRLTLMANIIRMAAKRSISVVLANWK
ncbi:hypothetical protein SUGI_0073560 [Cryptomeria japonica]|nr:hypothetical protein SUGI_0073560 [Cryptomeria japonica]